MTPLELLIVVVALSAVRFLITLRAQRPVEAGASPRPSRPSRTAIANEYLDAGIVAGLVALLMITFVVRTFYIPSGSMEPTLQVDDVLLADEFGYRFSRPKDGDIVIFAPAVPTTNDFIKRLIAGPGEKLRITDGVVYRDDTPLVEPYIAQKPDYDLEVRDYGIYVDGVALDPATANIPPKSLWPAPNRIPDGCYFMMGDNRNDSEDSHVWGFAQSSGTFWSGPEKGMKAGFTGRAFLIFWPPSRARLLR